MKRLACQASPQPKHMVFGAYVTFMALATLINALFICAAAHHVPWWRSTDRQPAQLLTPLKSSALSSLIL